MKAGFDDFFGALWGYAPFPWQSRLAARLAEDSAPRWPGCLALPTASGKTACIDVAIFDLARQAHREASERTAPRKILFVVDRRVIVDEAFERAKRIAEKLFAAKSGVLAEIAAALSKLSATDAPLTCHQLRGGVYRDDAWARTPTQVCVIASTVDQIGSRLLFRGYGRSECAWSIDAGLAANDTLLLLDEAHCSNPFRQTLEAVGRYRGANWAEKPVARPFEFAILSATPPAELADGAIRLGDDDRAHPLLRARLEAAKPTRLVVEARAKGKNSDDELAVRMLEEAIGLVGEGRTAIALMVNRVAVAKTIFELLQSPTAKPSPEEDGDPTTEDQTTEAPSAAEETDGEQATKKRLEKLRNGVAKAFRKAKLDPPEAALLVGRMRPFDSREVVRSIQQRLKTGGQDRPDRPFFVVATQCLEVGADLDFDGLVSECASLDALRQRFGRLNRAGRDVAARGVVVLRGEHEKDSSKDPVYGAALAATWSWLSENADGVEPTFDFGVVAVERVIDSAPPEAVRAAPDAPVMLPVHVDAWVQTFPAPEPTPEPALFLHGPREGAPEIAVCWRDDLWTAEQRKWLDARPVRYDRLRDEDLESQWTEAVALCPPTAMESLQVPLHVFRRWWNGAGAGVLSDLSSEEETEVGEGASKPRYALLWKGAEKSRLFAGPKAPLASLRPGDLLVLPAAPLALTGVDVLGYVPSAAEKGSVRDVGDECHELARRRVVVRLHPRLTSLSLAGLEDPEEATERLQQAIDGDDASGTLPDRLTKHWNCGTLGRRTVAPHPVEGWVVSWSKKLSSELATKLDEPEEYVTEDDASLIAEADSPLAGHLDDVANRVADFAAKCGLEQPLQQALRLAAKHHDWGKLDRRFQRLLHGPRPISGEALAKSRTAPRSPAERRRLRALSRLPEGFRHELLSLQLAERFAELPPEVDRELVLHLVASHHGRCRPFAPIVLDEPEDHERSLLKLDLRPAGPNELIDPALRAAWTPPHRLDSGVAERFWRLTRKYGWWGLAYLEALLRLADHRASEAEEERRSPSPDKPFRRTAVEA